MQNRFLDNKVVLKYCPDYYRIINEEFNELDYMSDKIIQVFQQYIFSIDIRNKNDIKKISSLNKAIVRYFDDREFIIILTNFLLALKVPKGTKNVVSIIVDNIIEQHLKYMEGFTRNIYIPRWI